MPLCASLTCPGCLPGAHKWKHCLLRDLFEQRSRHLVMSPIHAFRASKLPFVDGVHKHLGSAEEVTNQNAHILELVDSPGLYFALLPSRLSSVAVAASFCIHFDISGWTFGGGWFSFFLVGGTFRP
mmetsp:Transcript_16123/g.32287  ORF Transcript_16123/g.32287 Transcript_16123/m.32287 type:complete len:126 (-) Transcript_16123:11-388(-)